MGSFKVVQWFGGIGADVAAIKRLNISYKIVDYVEIEKHAVKSYNLLNGTSYQTKDINDVDVSQYNDVDLLVAGWPCQDLSTAGKQAGLIDGKRSNLIYTTIKKIKEMKRKPRIIILENVKGLLNKKHAGAFKNIQKQFKELGYYFSYKLLNAKYFNVPQNRERVYCVLTRDKKYNWEWSGAFNKPANNLNEYLEPNPDDYYYITQPSMFKAIALGKIKIVDDVCNTITTKQFRWNSAGVIKEKNKLRVLTARECWKLMGFNNDEFNKVKDETSINQLYKQAGNSIVVNVLQEIIKNVL